MRFSSASGVEGGASAAVAGNKNPEPRMIATPTTTAAAGPSLLDQVLTATKQTERSRS